MPPNPPDNRLDKGSSDPPNVAETPQVAMTLWSLYLEEANERAKAKADMWNSSIGAFLLFAGLFAGVVASFVIDSRTGLKPNPSAPVPATTVAINFLWFLSLTFTLISALAAVLAQTWVVKFSLAPTKGFEAAKERWIHDNKADRWRLHTAIAWITVLIQLALFLFLAGFAVQAVVDNRDIGWTILSLVGTTVVLYIIITILPWLSPTSPFRTPFSDLNTRNQSVYLSDSSSLRPAARGAKDRTIYAWQSLRSSWHDLIETPEPSHVRLGICSWILRNSFKNGSIHAAVVELTRNPLTQENCERLVQFGLPDDLCIRLTELVNSPDSSARVERMNNFLRAIIWMVNGAIPRVEVTKVAKGFYPLLGLEGALLTLDVLPAECRALAFGVRVHLLLSGCDGKEIQATDWNTMVDNLEHDSALSVFRAATRGLESDDKHLPQDCARMLAVYIGSARFSNESLAADQTEYVRFFKIQPEPVRLIQRFFKELEQAWKVSMCSRAIQLLEETRFDLQVAGLRALSYLAENHTFRTTVHEALPHLFKILKDVDWHTSVACLQKLSDIYKQEPFRRAINAIFPDIIALLSDPDERVRSAVLQLSDLVDQDELIDSIKDISGDLIKDLQDPDWSIRVARLQILTELIKTGKIPTVIENAVPNILDCLSFSDEDVRLRAIQALHEIAQHGAFKHLINTNMPVIVMCMSDDDSRVCAALVRFLSDLAPQDTFKEAINDNFRAIVDDTLESEEGTVRRSGLRALCELIKSDQYVGAIKNAFCDLQIWLSDTDEDVREAALQAVSLASEKGAFLAIITEIIPKVVLMLKDPQENVRTSAIETFSTLAKDERGSFSDAIKLAIPAITSGLDPESTEGTQIATLKKKLTEPFR
ncbi:armadillo-type protein [Mycena rosella]|uniref:Armadillo-type protein n=1 Tax=Mycena rosella TaxID=1033263 RepID=A0AAD7D883_MYCRO|nr:armadillo-type protein [Mycena rosella]